MSEWLEQDIPAFAVVGRVNMGKSSVISTLLEIDDNELIRVSPTPGETTRCQIHRVAFGGRECLRFIDTPGFSRPIEALRVIQRLHGPGTPGMESLRRFVAEAGEDFADERQLLGPLIEGAGVLYVVDPARPLRDDFLAEMEILRWTGRPRLALLNGRRGVAAESGHESAWRLRLGAAFNLVRSFDAHQARYPERLRLLRALLEIDESHRARLEETIELVENEWIQRREDSAEALVGFLDEALALRVAATLEERDLRMPSSRRRKVEHLRVQYFERLSAIERGCFSKLLEIHRHHLLRADASPESFRQIDLQSAETWTKWGLTRTQLAATAAAVGGAAGLAVDAATGGLSHGAGAVFGAIGSATLAWLKGGSLPDLRIDLKGGLKLAPGQGRTVKLGPPQSPNFPWILLDGALTRYARILARAHGRRDPETLEGGDEGYTRHFPRERRERLAKWFRSCAEGSPNRALEPDVFSILCETLEEIERSSREAPAADAQA